MNTRCLCLFREMSGLSWVCVTQTPRLQTWCGARPCPCQAEQSGCCGSVELFGLFSSFSMKELRAEELWGGEESVLVIASLHRSPEHQPSRDLPRGGCFCLRKWCCSYGTFAEVSERGSWSCHGFKTKREKETNFSLHVLLKHPLKSATRILIFVFKGTWWILEHYRRVKCFGSRNMRPFPHLCLLVNYLVLVLLCCQSERRILGKDVLEHCLLWWLWSLTVWKTSLSFTH